MHDESSAVSTRPAEQEADSDRDVLYLLTADDAQRPWSSDEVAREIGDRAAAVDSLDRLYGAGLIHRLGEGFVFATRAAVTAASRLDR